MPGGIPGGLKVVLRFRLSVVYRVFKWRFCCFRLIRLFRCISGGLGSVSGGLGGISGGLDGISSL